MAHDLLQSQKNHHHKGGQCWIVQFLALTVPEWCHLALLLGLYKHYERRGYSRIFYVCHTVIQAFVSSDHAFRINLQVECENKDPAYLNLLAHPRICPARYYCLTEHLLTQYTASRLRPQGEP